MLWKCLASKWCSEYFWDERPISRKRRAICFQAHHGTLTDFLQYCTSKVWWSRPGFLLFWQKLTIVHSFIFKHLRNCIFELFQHVSKSQYFFSNLNYNCSNLLDLRNLQEKVKKAFCYQKLFWPFTA